MSRAANRLFTALFIILAIFVYLAVVKQPQPTPKVTLSQAPTNDDDPTNSDVAPAVSKPSEKTLTEAPDASCHSHDILPDPNCTPGAVDPAVTQDNIQQTICKPGYSKSVRPSSSITNKQKVISMKEYGFTDSPSHYEYDHLISLELGGAPDDTKNLWPEPGASPNPKDKVENKLHELVCKGTMPLATAQQRIAQNWKTAEDGF